MSRVTLAALTQDDREQFISDNQEAFNYGALEEFGRRDDHFEDGETSFPARPLRTASTEAPPTE